MGIGGYLLVALIGIGTVFLALIFLMIIIKILTYQRKGKVEDALVVEETSEQPAVEPVLAPGSAGELKLYDTDPRDAAMCMAIVADELGVPLNELRFISIREVKE
ncbi:MAG: OadG family protein [bacterium]|nr:OadG family protein [bacterium]